MPQQLDHIYIKTDNINSPFVQSLRRLLLVNDVVLVDHKKDATAVLHLSDVQTSQQLVALSGSSQAGQYRVNTQVTFSVTTPDGKRVLPPTPVVRTGYFNSNATQILSANNVGAQLSTNMQQELAEAIVEQLARIPQKQSNEATSQ